jgi:hypothetical protein
MAGVGVDDGLGRRAQLGAWSEGQSIAALNPSGWGINIVDAPLSGACHVLWGPTGTPWWRAEGCTM